MRKLAGPLFCLLSAALIFAGADFEVKESKCHEKFFARINVKFPFTLDLQAHLSARNYYSAYFILCDWLLKSDHFIQVNQFVSDRYFRQWQEFKEFFPQLAPGNYKSGFLPDSERGLALIVLLISEISELYRNGNLSGEKAAGWWQIIADAGESCYRMKKINHNAAAILMLTSRMVFFKRSGKWRKKSVRFFEKNRGPFPALVSSILDLKEKE